MTEMVIGFKGLRLRDLALGRLLFDAVRSAAERGYRMPREMTMIGKTLLNIDEVARRLDPDFDPNASIRKHAAAIANQRMLADFSPGKLMTGLLEMKKLAETLPRRLNQVIEAVAENRLRVKVDAIDEVMLLEGMQKIANRITVGVMIAAMIIGAAMLMRIDTHFKILGYPGLAILFFLAAAFAAIFLMGDIFFHDYKSAKEKKKALKLQKNKPATG
jgi:predicted unusual protein kinase regulating ubiquinone biosynthesis (AarF/ABC1/UbiB family)